VTVSSLLPLLPLFPLLSVCKSFPHKEPRVRLDVKYSLAYGAIDENIYISECSFPHTHTHTHTPVVPQVVLSPEGLVADVAGVRALVRVCPLVDQQIVGLCKVSPAKLANKFLFALGRESPARGLAVRAQFPQCSQCSQLRSRFRRVLLRGREREVGEVESRSVLVQRGHDARHRSVFGEQMRGEGKRRGEREARVQEPRNLRVPEGPVVDHAVAGAQPVAGIRARGELQEQRRVKRHRGRESLTAHIRSWGKHTGTAFIHSFKVVSLFKTCRKYIFQLHIYYCGFLTCKALLIAVIILLSTDLFLALAFFSLFLFFMCRSVGYIQL